MSKSLLLFTLGPVQGFITEARRTRDLWAGSQILVELIRSAAKAAQLAGATLIFPSDLDTASLPNRFVAEVDSDQAVTVAEAAETAAKAQWQRLAIDTKVRLEQKIGSGVWRDTYDTQIDRHFEFFWSVCDALPGSAYADWYRDTAAAVAARKLTRNFLQSEQAGIKDALSGMRSALANGPSAEDMRAFWVNVGENFSAVNPTLVRSGGREYLDALGAVKRFGRVYAEDETRSFPSVSSIAAAGFLRSVQAQGQTGLEALSAYSGTLAGITDANRTHIFKPEPHFPCPAVPRRWKYDGDLLYPEGLTAQAMDTEYHISGLADNDPALREARATLRALYKAAAARPSSYYGILVMDGDRMGNTVRACDSKEAHQTLSQALLTFANQARVIVEQTYAGRLVYAGGDDVLALLPIADVFKAAYDLRKAFAERIGTTTISAGIALAHHKSPLSFALRAARQAEESAKDGYGRDALCVHALKRSGEHMQLGMNWSDALDESTPPHNALLNMIDLFSSAMGQNSPLSSKLAFDLKQESHVYPDAGMAEAFGVRLAYLTQRHITDTGQRDDIMTRLVPHLTRWATPMGAGQLRAECLADWLLLARFVAEGGQD